MSISDQVRFLGYNYAAFNVILAVWIAVRSLGFFGTGYESDTILGLKFVLAVCWTGFSILLMIGIRTENINHINKYMGFVKVRSVCLFLYLLNISVRLLVQLTSSEKIGRVCFIGTVLITLLTLFIGIVMAELWAIRSIKQSIQTQNDQSGAVTPKEIV
ncbi:uncharacterized protein LOC129756591 isoform X2 [Uranotaenia lowii]|uniref:uncharacterized protein LOC129756591 isoform X2 n=1 Tax=Uranotaenia lowii TaxID=190385 RepID=UPI0024786A72|nr:uncharacterized protein LOC129756591 isoform X2 [Uranotaenia lowii]